MVSYPNNKSLRVFRYFEIPMFYRYEYYMSISHMAVSSVNCEYGTPKNEFSEISKPQYPHRPHQNWSE